MNSKNLFKFIGVILLSMTMVYGSCNEKDDPEPPPPAYVPTFKATSLASGIDIIFGVICTTDNFTFTKLVVTAPTTEQDTYVGTGAIVLSGETVPTDVYPRLSGTWTFTITGTISGGTNAGTGFVTSTTVNVSAK